jgi:hypothetical protein
MQSLLQEVKYECYLLFVLDGKGVEGHGTLYKAFEINWTVIF